MSYRTRLINYITITLIVFILIFGLTYTGLTLTTPVLKENFFFEVAKGTNTCSPFTKPGEKPDPKFCCPKGYMGRPGAYEMTNGWWVDNCRPDSYTQEDCNKWYPQSPSPSPSPPPLIPKQSPAPMPSPGPAPALISSEEGKDLAIIIGSLFGVILLGLIIATIVHGTTKKGKRKR